MTVKQQTGKPQAQQRQRSKSRSRGYRGNGNKSNFDAIQYETVLDSISINVDAVDRRDNEVFVTLPCQLPVQQQTVGIRLKVDTGAGGNTDPLRMLKKVYDKEMSLNMTMLS